MGAVLQIVSDVSTSPVASASGCGRDDDDHDRNHDHECKPVDGRLNDWRRVLHKASHSLQVVLQDIT